MLVKTSPVQVLHRAPYSDPNDADPLLWGTSAGDAEGTFIEKLLVLDPVSGKIFDNLTVDPACGDVKAGMTCELSVEIRREAKAAYSRSAREYVAVKDKWRVVDFKVVREVAAVANGAPA